MHPAVPVLAGNMCAFTLGVMVTLWLIAMPAKAPPAPVVAGHAATAPGHAAAAEDHPHVAVASPTAVATAAPIASATTAAQVVDQRAAPVLASGSATLSAAVSPAPAAPTPASSGTKGASRGAYLLQFGAFSEADNAKRMQADLKKYGYAADVVPVVAGSTAWLMVRLDGFPDRNAAAETAAALQHDTGIGALMMRSVAQ